jgi:uncharacterized protein YxeA
MKKAFIIITILLVAAAGAGYYFYHQEMERQRQEKAIHDSIRHAREVENARLAAIDKARRDSSAAYELTHGTQVIKLRMEQLLRDEIRNGRNHVGGKNWSEKMNILREQCDNVIAYSNERADTVFRTFSFKGLMGKDVRVKSDSILRVYYVSEHTAYVDVRYEIGDEQPEGQDVSFILSYEKDEWLLDDFTFIYSDGTHVTESEEMKWFIETYGKAEE